MEFLENCINYDVNSNFYISNYLKNLGIMYL